MDIVQKKDVRPFTMLHIDFLDCETLSSNEKILLAILMRYSHYGKNSPSATFPSFAGLAKKTGLAEKVVRTTLQLLEEKQLISKQARYRNGTKARAANFYVIQDTPSIWKSLEISSDDSNLFDDTIKEAIELLQTAGYKVMETEKNKKHFFDVGASEKNELASSNNVNFTEPKGIRPFTIIYNDLLDFEGLRSKEKLLLILLKSQAKVLKLHAKEANAEIVSTTKSEQYSMDFLYSHFDYKSVHMITIQRGFSADIVDSVFSVLYDTLNSSIINIPIGKELKPTVIVISKLLKLDCWDLLYVIEKYNSQVTEIYSPVRWIQTALYFAREENHLKTINQIAYNMSRSDNI